MVAIISIIILSGCDNGKNKRDPRILWEYDIEDTYLYYSSPVLSGDEQTIYLGTSIKAYSQQSDNDRLIALNRDGTLKWEYNTQGGEIRSNILVYGDEIFFIADFGRNNTSDTKTKSEVSGNGKTTGPKFNIVIHNAKILVVSEYIYVFDCNEGTEKYKSERLYAEGVSITYIRAYLNGGKAFFIMAPTYIILIWKLTK